MVTVTIFLFVLAFLCFIGSAFGIWSSNPRGPALTALGLAFWILALLLQLMPR